MHNKDNTVGVYAFLPTSLEGTLGYPPHQRHLGMARVLNMLPLHEEFYSLRKKMDRFLSTFSKSVKKSTCEQE